ncbi:MAG: hypothetical protein AW12_02290 [Candidatus Accumulibacter sp. BA-94]|nr:MAG: hypothetical protein AW12_02290 [Candidatus Accumulibacter sp. BA-94]
MFEQRIALGTAIVVHRLNVDQIGRPAAGQQDTAEVGFRGETAGTVDRIENRHRDIVDRLDSRLRHLADDIDLLAAECHHPHIELHPLDELGQSRRQKVAQLTGRPARRLDHTDVRIKDRAVFGNHRAGLLRRPEAAGRDRQFRVIPDDDRNDVARPQPVIGNCRRVLAPVARVVRRRRLRRTGAVTAWRQGRLEEIDDQLGSDRPDAHVRRHELICLLHRQPDVGFLAVAVVLVAGENGAPCQRPQSEAEQHSSPRWRPMSQQVHANILISLHFVVSFAAGTGEALQCSVGRRIAQSPQRGCQPRRSTCREFAPPAVPIGALVELPGRLRAVTQHDGRVTCCKVPSGAKSHTMARKPADQSVLQASLLTHGSRASSISCSASACASSPRL